MANIGVQAFYLRRPRCMELYTIIHELLHNLGLEHMHNSLDRDNYIDIDFNNILPENRVFFNIVNPAYYSYFGTTYDYASVMHYRSKDFAINKDQRTIYVKVKDYANLRFVLWCR